MAEDTRRLLLRPAEAAECLGVGMTLLHELLSTRELKSLKFGRKRLIAMVDLEAFVEQRRLAAEEDEQRLHRRFARRLA